MTSESSISTDAWLSRWGGSLVAIGAFFIVVAIVTFLASGAVAPAGAQATEVAAALTSGTGLLAFSAYLSIPADFSLLVGAVLLASRSAATPAALAARAAWVTIAVATLLVVQFDLLLPRGLVPLAANVEQAPLVFEALYHTSNYTHSVGLFMTFACFLMLFVQQTRVAAARVVPRGVAIVAVVAWSLGLIVAAGLILDRPLVMLAPSILLGWLLVSFMGLRLARVSMASARPASEATHVRG